MEQLPEEVKKALIELENLRQTIILIETQLKELENVYNEIEKTKATIEAIKNKSTEEFFIDLGSGVYAKVKLTDTKLLVKVEEKIILEQTPEDTLKDIEESLNTIKSSIEELNRKREELMTKYQQIVQKIEEYQSLKK